jgi:hypothetical protein
VDISIKTNGELELKIVLSIKNDEEPRKAYKSGLNRLCLEKWLQKLEITSYKYLD